MNVDEFVSMVQEIRRNLSLEDIGHHYYIKIADDAPTWVHDVTRILDVGSLRGIYWIGFDIVDELANYAQKGKIKDHEDITFAFHEIAKDLTPSSYDTLLTWLVEFSDADRYMTDAMYNCDLSSFNYNFYDLLRDGYKCFILDLEETLYRELRYISKYRKGMKHDRQENF